MGDRMVCVSYKIDGSLREMRSVPLTGETEPTGRRVEGQWERVIICPVFDVEAYVTLDFNKVTKHGAYGDHAGVVKESITVKEVDLLYPSPKYYG